jgi:hypothetical protein
MGGELALKEKGCEEKLRQLWTMNRILEKTKDERRE